MEVNITLKLDPELISRIDESRSDLSRDEYIRLCLARTLESKDGEASSPTPQAGAEFVTREDFEEFKTEIEKFHFEMASLLTKFCQEHAGELNESSGTHFYEQFVKLLQS